MQRLMPQLQPKSFGTSAARDTYLETIFTPASPSKLPAPPPVFLMGGDRQAAAQACFPVTHISRPGPRLWKPSGWLIQRTPHSRSS